MEPVCSLKRDRSVAQTLCIVCAEDTGVSTSELGVRGRSALQAALETRRKQRDLETRIVVDRLDTILASDSPGKLYYHKNCYSTFTSKDHLLRSSKPKATSSKEASTSQAPAQNQTKRSTTVLRSSVAPMNWKACMFCQDAKSKLTSVTTFNKSNTILEASKYDPVIHVRLSGVHDLIAAEGKYHNNCYQSFLYKTSKTEQSAGEEAGIAMEWLVMELKKTAQKAQVLELSEVWKYFCELVEETGEVMPQSFLSRRSTFKTKLQARISGFYDCITLQPPERQIVLVPTAYGTLHFSELMSEERESLQIPKYQATYEFLEMVHVALKLRSDILSHPVCKGFVVSEDRMIAFVPDSIFMFLRLMFGGQTLLEEDPEEDYPDSEDPSQKEAVTQTQILSIGQDMVYNVTGGKHWTPKHLGLGSALHQATRSKELVNLFHNAGHTVSYKNILQVDTALAESTLKEMDPATGAVTPPNIVPNRFVHFTCDNIDINDSNFDGKNSFHATQVAAWQRGPEADMGMDAMEPSNKTSLVVPEIMEEIMPAGVIEGKAQPKTVAEKAWFEESAQDCDQARQAVAKDMTFFVNRQKRDNSEKGWTHFNQTNSTTSPEITSAGYLPIVQAPAHELDTLHTVVLRCKHVARKLGQHQVVLTVDEALYCKLMELKWAREEYQDFLVVRLGGLHTAMKFLQVIGKHVQSSGLQEAWMESNVLGPNTTEQVMSGKSYAKGMRAHKLTLQAMWRLLVPQLLAFISDSDQELGQQIQEKITTSDTAGLVTLFASKDLIDKVENFVAAKNNPNFRF